MDIEKVVNSKWYKGFDWLIRLIFLNFLTVIIPIIIGGGPVIYWYINYQYYGIELTEILVIISAILLPFAFIPCFITAFYMIKYYMDENTGSLFKLYFVYLWDTLKRIYKLELIMVPITVVLIYSLFYYWEILGPEYFMMNAYGILSIIAFAVVFFCLMAILFAFMHLPIIVSYFRMKTMDYLKLSFIMAFKYILKTLLNLALLAIPIAILMLLFQSVLIKLFYLLYGLSFPLFIIYKANKDLYWYLSNNIDDINATDKFNS